jgi:hypothetical protein
VFDLIGKGKVKRRGLSPAVRQLNLMDDIVWTNRELRSELKKFGNLTEENGELVLQVEGKRLLDGK